MVRHWGSAVRFVVSVTIIFGILSTAKAGGASCDPIATAAQQGRPIDLVICLDTSNSMDGLIDSARARLWDIVNSLGSARPIPDLRVGLITYGSPSRSTASHGWVVLQTQLTNNLDYVYSKMMEFRTDGGDEFVGWALHDAITKMNWSGDPRALKLVFIAGNESADQARDVFDFRNVVRAARHKGITINAIYAGDRNAGMNEHWSEVATCGGGSYASIDMNCGTIQIDAPQDKLLLELNMKLNATYVPYGDAGREGEMQQRAQDANADRLGRQTAASRVAAKSKAVYRNESWDLVDAVVKGDKKVADVKDADLPAAMRLMSAPQREEHVQKKQAEREEIQKQIAELSAQRDKHVKEERARTAGGKVALDDAMLKSIREQAKQQGFEFTE